MQNDEERITNTVSEYKEVRITKKQPGLGNIGEYMKRT